MQTGVKWNSRETEDTFACPICMDMMNPDEDRGPRVMCRNLHTICKKCSLKMENTESCVVCKEPSVDGKFVKVPVISKFVDTAKTLHTTCMRYDKELDRAYAFSKGIELLQEDPFVIVDLKRDIVVVAVDLDNLKKEHEKLKSANEKTRDALLDRMKKVTELESKLKAREEQDRVNDELRKHVEQMKVLVSGRKRVRFTQPPKS